MDGMYERMLRKKDPLPAAEALRESALALRADKRFSAPRFWASFVAYGR